MGNWVSLGGKWVDPAEAEAVKKAEAEKEPEVRDRRPRAERNAPKVEPKIVKVKLEKKSEKIEVKKVVQPKLKTTKSKPKGRK